MYIRGFNPPLAFSFSFFFTQCLVPDSAPALLTTPSPPRGNPLHTCPPFSSFCLLCPEASDRGPSTQLQELLCPTRYDIAASLITHPSAPRRSSPHYPPRGNPLHAFPSFSFLDQGPSTQLRELLRLTRYDIAASLTTHHTPPPVLSPLRKGTWWPYLPLLWGRPVVSLSKPLFDRR
jgi:hypothetical protein